MFTQKLYIFSFFILFSCLLKMFLSCAAVSVRLLQDTNPNKWINKQKKMWCKNSKWISKLYLTVSSIFNPKPSSFVFCFFFSLLCFVLLFLHYFYKQINEICISFRLFYFIYLYACIYYVLLLYYYTISVVILCLYSYRLRTLNYGYCMCFLFTLYCGCSFCVSALSSSVIWKKKKITTNR